MEANNTLRFARTNTDLVAAEHSSERRIEARRTIKTIKAEYVPDLLVLLGGSTETILELLAREYTGARSYELERILRESGIPIERFVYQLTGTVGTGERQ